jgi:hypothetical protein
MGGNNPLSISDALHDLQDLNYIERGLLPPIPSPRISQKENNTMESDDPKKGMIRAMKKSRNLTLSWCSLSRMHFMTCKT